MRTLLLVLVSSAVLVVGEAQAGPAQGTQAAPGEAVFLVWGRGWGHGVGMSQYGAYGMANEEATYNKILTYFYAGTQIGRTPTSEVRVLLGEGKRALTVSSSLPF